MTDTITRNPKQIDKVLSGLYEQAARPQAMAARIRGRIREREEHPTRHGFGGTVEELREELAGYEEKLSELQAKAAPFEAIYTAKPWARYFLVIGYDGHVHRGMYCSTCFRTTAFQWLVDLADESMDAMVEKYGEKACTVCFPDAPTSPKWAAAVERDKAAAAAEAEKFCPQKFQQMKSWSVRWVKCALCGNTVSVTSTGRLRKHKKAA